ncbi:MAG: Glu/Leu/Phe/Val dehydrogenase [Syntrophales bacterium]
MMKPDLEPLAGAQKTVPGVGSAPPEIRWDDGLGFRTITGDTTPGNELLKLIAERIRMAGHHLQLTRDDLFRIFNRHSIFEGEADEPGVGGKTSFILVETHHLIQGRVGKGALKLVFPQDLLGQESHFQESEPGVVEVVRPPGAARWANAAEAEALVKRAMREFMTGESLSMSLKSQATGAPFAGSEGLMLCAAREFDEASGRYRLKSLLNGGEESAREDKELIERMMNGAAEMLTRTHRIAYDKIVHAAETNTTLAARLGLQLATNVVEGHLRTLLVSDPAIIIGDEDMTSRLREILERKNYSPTACALARAAAKMQLEHEIILPESRDQLRNLLHALPGQGSPTPAEYRALMDLFFGTGVRQQKEDQLYHHREPILRALSVALSTRCLDKCGEPSVLSLYLTTLLDNQWIMMERALARLLPPGQALPVGWFHPSLLFTPEEREALAAHIPAPGISREELKERFWSVVSLLCEARDRVTGGEPDLYRQARADVLERAIQAITATGEVVPTVQRIAFFTLPLAYECATPKLGVVTRKPPEICGSELRSEAMAQGAMMAVEILLKKLTGKMKPLEGMTVAIEGLGNAGKNMASLMVQKGATILAVSDSRGAVIIRDGFSRQELAAIVAHKNSGKRFDTILASPVIRMLSSKQRAALVYHPDPAELKKVAADILVLTAIPASIRGANVGDLRVNVICELTGAAVSGDAKQILKKRGIQVIPDNLASSGGLLVSLSEMLQNSLGQVWDRRLEEENLYRQIERSFEAVWAVTKRYDLDLATASDILALQRMHDLAIYREHLEALSAQLAERIRGIGTDERVLILSDNDEDGVASAAIMHRIIASLNPGTGDRITHLNESFRSPSVPDFITGMQDTGMPVRQVFALDRAFPLDEPGRTHVAWVADHCRLTLINNHELPAPLLEQEQCGAGSAGAGYEVKPASLGILHISPQTLKSIVSGDQFPTAMILKEIATLLINDAAVLDQIAWQAAVGCCLDAALETTSEWQLFYSRFNGDRTVEAARALRLITRANGYLTSVHALLGVDRPDQLETHEVWEQCMAAYRILRERVLVLVERITLENRGRAFASHFFTPDEVISPTPIVGNENNELDFYHWISEYLTQRGDWWEKPIIVGQVVTDHCRRPCLGVRIRSPRGVDLMKAGLPECFTTGGLPNTAIARIPLEPTQAPQQVFQNIVDNIWTKTTRASALTPREEIGPN